MLIEVRFSFKTSIFGTKLELTTRTKVEGACIGGGGGSFSWMYPGQTFAAVELA